MKFAGWLLSALTLAACLGTAPSAEAGDDPWGPFRFLLGRWIAEDAGQGNSLKGDFTFAFDLQGKALVRRGRAEFDRGPARPPTTHDDLMVLSQDGPNGPVRAHYFDNEGHVILYAVEPSEDGKAVTFLSEPRKDSPRFRLRHAKLADDRLGIVFEIESPDKPSSFRTHLSGTARRGPRSNIELDLPRGYVCHRVREPIDIDGKLDEKAWQDAPWTEAFVDIEGDLKPRPRLQTRAKMLWDDRYFYVAAHLEEPHVWGTLTKHDSVIFQDNDFEIFIDPDGDNHEYYEIEINALNTEWDLFLKKPYRDGGPAINEWEIPGLRTAVHIDGTLNDPSDTDRSWSVEFAIPWKVMAEYSHRPAPPRDGDQWHVNFSRVEWRHEIVDGHYRKVPDTREDNWVWSPQGYIDMHKPEYWGLVQFSTAAPGSVAFRRDPASPVRDRLIDAYYAQRRYREKHKKWADDASSLELPTPLTGMPRHPIVIRTTENGFVASVTFRPDGKVEQTWTIREDSRIEMEPSR
jgi:hypothetical protein